MAFIDKPDYSIDVAMIYAQASVTDLSGAMAIGPLGWGTLIDINGKGKTIFIMLYSTYNRMQFHIEIDGNDMNFVTDDYLEPYTWQLTYSDVNYGLGVRLTKYDVANGYFCFVITLPYEFRSRLRIRAYNWDAVFGHSCAACVQYLDLRRTA